MRQTVPAFASSFRFFRNPATAFLVIVALVFGTPNAFADAKYAAVVVDANTGKTLFSSSADSARYPASLTKMMTLYLTFEAMTAGKISKDTRVPFSIQAASRPPTKIGVKAGGSITVEQAILSLVTKSANDSATALSELLGGSEQNFARMMTAKARKLGMSRTTFRNASGLPDAGQKTTARDMAMLGIALREHFPRHYGYFSTRSFAFGKSRMGNHNKLLGRVKGVDGIKTGYIRASGFNLVTSIQDDGKSVVAVVMGGSSGRSRDAHMTDLLQTYMPKASRRDRGPLIASRTIEPGTLSIASAVASLLPKRSSAIPDARPGNSPELALPTPEPAPAEPELADTETASRADAAEVDPIATSSTGPSGWVIQVASLPSEPEAIAFLTKTAKKAPSLLAEANAFTQTFNHKGSTYYRARFGGFASKSAAWSLCGKLKTYDVNCYAVQQ